MRWVAAPLAAVIAAAALAGCGEGGAEPGASREATLVLDFQPNAVHAGLYAALAGGYYEQEGVELEIREPSASTDGPKLLAAGRADFAVLDIHDLGLARERGIDVVGLGAIVLRPLAAVIAADRAAVRSPRDLEGGAVGVTGLPSDEAVLDSVLKAGAADPASVDRVTIGFDAVAALSAGRLDAATAFWNAEGVSLRRLGVQSREFRVDEYGAPPYPELVLATSARTLADDPALAEDVLAATGRGYGLVISEPRTALDALVGSVDGLDRTEQRAQLEALLDGDALGPNILLDPALVEDWARWALRRGILSRAPDIDRAFDFSLARD